jgi:hypothetical protein
MRIAIDLDYHAEIAEAMSLANAPAGSRAAERLAEVIQAVEEYEARRGWWIADNLRLSAGIARYRAQAGLTS